VVGLQVRTDHAAVAVGVVACEFHFSTSAAVHFYEGFASNSTPPLHKLPVSRPCAGAGACCDAETLGSGARLASSVPPPHQCLVACVYCMACISLCRQS
jgi:hypothetical protein